VFLKKTINKNNFEKKKHKKMKKKNNFGRKKAKKNGKKTCGES
jgi:hypothetical protein